MAHEALFDAADAAYFQGDVDGARELLPRLEALYESAPHDTNLLRALLRCAMCLIFVARESDLTFLAETSARVERFAELCPDTAETLTFRAERSIARMSVTGSVMDLQFLREEATSLLEEAYRREPENLHVLLVSGQFHYYTPETFGGSRDKARLFFLAATKHARFGAAMERLLGRKFGTT